MTSSLIRGVILVLFTAISAVPGESADHCELEETMIRHGLVDVLSVDSTLTVDLVNASAGNMLGVNLYGCLTRCYLQPETARRVSQAQAELKKIFPGYSLKILDGTRPRSVQRMMWDMVKNTALRPYIANPATGSMHNYGTAVDVTIIDESGSELDMGEPDVRRLIVGSTDEEIRNFFAGIRLTQHQRENRALLTRVMTGAGFRPLAHEWWHFELFTTSYVRKTFEILE